MEEKTKFHKINAFLYNISYYIVDLLKFQKEEITEYEIYKKLALKAREENKKVLEKIANEELKHYNKWKKYTGKDVKPSKAKIMAYVAISKIFGITFAIKMMEGGEAKAQKNYEAIMEKIPEAEEILKEETQHERLLINMIDEERINYIGSMVLGVNDAIVEITGTLAGLTFALQNTKIVGMAGLITGIAASLSMASSEYLSKKSEGETKPGKSAFYTGMAYIMAVFMLILPYFILNAYIHAFAFMIFDAIIVIAIFIFFIAVVKEENFKKLFGEMLFISMGIAFISFLIGMLARMALNVEV